jgi:hypothetical protein
MSYQSHQILFLVLLLLIQYSVIPKWNPSDQHTNSNTKKCKTKIKPNQTLHLSKLRKASSRIPSLLERLSNHRIWTNDHVWTYWKLPENKASEHLLSPTRFHKGGQYWGDIWRDRRSPILKCDSSNHLRIHMKIILQNSLVNIANFILSCNVWNMQGQTKIITQRVYLGMAKSIPWLL